MRDPSQWLERLTDIVKVPASSDPVEFARVADEAVLKKSLFCLGFLQRVLMHCIYVSVSVLVSESGNCLV
jgi:hypothetical protein